MGSLLSLAFPAAPAAASKATQTEWDCPVCHSAHSDTTAVPCGHQSCLGCLLRHSAASRTCPRCSSPVLSARFSVLAPNDFLQCILSPAGAPPGPRSAARRALFRLAYSQGRPSPPAGPGSAAGLPAELWAQLLRGHERLLEPVRPWLRQSLDAIYGGQWWEARQVESIALSTLCICGPDRAGLSRMLQGYLGDYTAPLVHGLIHLTLQRCRDAGLQWPSRDPPAAEEPPGQGERPAASGDPAWPNGTPERGPGPEQQPREPGAARAPAQRQPREPGAARAPSVPRAAPQEDAPAPGPSAPRPGRTRRPRATGRSPRRACKSRRPWRARRRRPRGK